MRIRLSTRLILGVVIIEAVMLSVLVWNSVRLISSSHAELLENSTREETLLLVNIIAPGLLANDVALIVDSLSLLSNKKNITYIDVYDHAGKIVATLGDKTHLPVDIKEHLITSESLELKQDKTYEDATSDGIFDVVRKIEIYGQHLGTLHAGYSIESVRQLTKQTRLQNTSIAVIELILSIIVTVLLGVLMTRSLRRLEEGAQKFGSGELEHRIEIKGNDEITDVAHSFNQMASYLSKGQLALEQQNQTLVEQTHLLEEQGNHIRLLLDSTAEGIFGADLEGNCSFVNPACLRMLGYESQEELIGNSIHEMIHHTRADGSTYPKQQCQVRLATLKGENGHSDEEVHWRKDGSSFPVEWWSHPIIQDDKIIGSAVTFIDITDRHQAEHELQEAHDKLEVRVQERTAELENANNAKTKFLSRMSHELRTPLNAVIGFSELLKMRFGENDKSHQLAEKIFSSGHHLLTLIEEILDLSRIDSGNIKIHIESLELGQLINQTITFIQAQSEERGIAIELSDCAGVVVEADAIRLKEVMLNLLSNAVKYNSENGVIRITCKQDKENIIVSVSDTGTGLTEGQLSQLFEPFSRLGAEYTEIKGTGIGMTISKQLVELMHGSIDVSSVLNEGTTFRVTLPRA